MELAMLVDTAVTVPVNLLPMIDSTDFKTIDTGVVFNEAGLDLKWNFVTRAGVQTQTAVTPTNTGGAHDWVNKGGGMYNIEIPASGGTINNDAEGFGWFSGFATAVLPFRGPVIFFGIANVIDSLFGNGGDFLQVDLAQILGEAAAPQTISDTYQMKVHLFDDNTGTTDRYVVSFFKNGQAITNPALISDVEIQVVKVADGADLIAVTAMTQVTSQPVYRYSATAAERITNGVAYFAFVTATIESATRSWYQPVGRDS